MCLRGILSGAQVLALALVSASADAPRPFGAGFPARMGKQAGAASWTLQLKGGHEFGGDVMTEAPMPSMRFNPGANPRVDSAVLADIARRAERSQDKRTAREGMGGDDETDDDGDSERPRTGGSTGGGAQPGGQGGAQPGMHGAEVCSLRVEACTLAGRLWEATRESRKML
ncbi:hypothetical protein T484DRAFT_1799719 [Baffinella frigidus]|nr:hypothetical protein T484DRAFT_1799719 [Cryptophyta sp. CCMP2293]